MDEASFHRYWSLVHRGVDERDLKRLRDTIEFEIKMCASRSVHYSNCMARFDENVDYYIERMAGERRLRMKLRSKWFDVCRQIEMSDKQ